MRSWDVFLYHDALEAYHVYSQSTSAYVSSYSKPVVTYSTRRWSKLLSLVIYFWLPGRLRFPCTNAPTVHARSSIISSSILIIAVFITDK